MEALGAILAAEDDGSPAHPVTIACPSKTVQFVNHMILGSQAELSEIDELPKRLIREEAGRAFRLQALVSPFIPYTSTVSFHTSYEFLLCLQASMDMWLCMKQAISAAERAKRAYEQK